MAALMPVGTDAEVHPAMKAKRIKSRSEAEKLAAISDLELGRILRRSHLFRQGDKAVKSRHNRWWSAAEEQLLTRWPDVKVAKLLGRSVRGVQKHRLSMGFRHYRNRDWTKHEDALLAATVKDRKTKSFTRNLAKKLGRSFSAVQWRLHLKFGAIAPRRLWTPREKSLLGTKQDPEIAALIGRTAAAVRTRRRHLGIKAAVPCRRYTREEDHLLGKASDQTLARQLGRTLHSIQQRRHRLGKVYLSPHFWLPKQEKLLGTKSDEEIAALVGHTVAAVRKHRLELGRPLMNPKRHVWTTRDDAMLGAKTDLEVARLLGLTRTAVKTRRVRKGIPGIPMVRADGAKGWTAEETGLLGTRPDRELADLLHRSPKSILMKRFILGIPCFGSKGK